MCQFHRTNDPLIYQEMTQISTKATNRKENESQHSNITLKLTQIVSRTIKKDEFSLEVSNKSISRITANAWKQYK